MPQVKSWHAGSPKLSGTNVSCWRSGILLSANGIIFPSSSLSGFGIYTSLKDNFLKLCECKNVPYTGYWPGELESVVTTILLP